MPFKMKFAIRALTVLLILCGAALLVLSLRPARIERIPQAPASSTAGQNLGQFTALVAPLPAPALALTTRDGKQKQLADFKGKLVLVNLWATWCVPCVEEMPALDRLQQELGSDAFEVVALSVDRAGRSGARKFLDEAKVGKLALYTDPSARMAATLRAAGLPATLLIDREGREIGRLLGPAQWDGEDARRLIRWAVAS